MESLNLQIADKAKVLSGRAEGKSMRSILKLDERDNDEKIYKIRVPNVLSITASYFLACFGNSVRFLGEDKFKEKYKFSTSNPSIEKNIRDGIKSALNLSMPF